MFTTKMPRFTGANSGLSVIFLASLLTVGIVIPGCSRSEIVLPRVAKDETPSPSVAPKPETSPPPTLNSPIRSIDFRNFTYPAWPIFGKGRKTFTLRNGELPAKRDNEGRRLIEIGLSADVSYGYITGDGIEDAIIGFGEDNGGGTAIVHAAYIYTRRRGRPIFLWGFEAGDRADGGLRSIYAQNGELVIELKGAGKVIGKNLFGGDDTSKGLCCPAFFTRTRYRWNGRRFQQKGPSEILPMAGVSDVELFPETQQ